MKLKKIFRILIYTTIAVVLILIGISAYMFQFGGIESIVNNELYDLVEEDYLLDIEIGNIKGSLFSDLILENVNIVYNAPDRKYQLVKFPRIHTSYSISNIWDKKYLFDFLIIDSAEVNLYKDSLGNWVIPDFRKKVAKEAPSVVSFPEFSIGSVDIRNMSLRLLEKNDTINFEDIFLSLALKGEEKTYAFDIESFMFKSNKEYIALSAAGGKVTFDNNHFIFKDLSLVTHEARIKLDGNIMLGKEPVGELTFALDNISLEKISKYISPSLKGSLDLNGTVRFTKDTLSGRLNIGGDFTFMDFRNLYMDFTLVDKKLLIDSLYGTIFDDCNIDGSGFVDFGTKPEQYHLTADIKQLNLKNIIQNSFTTNLNGSIKMDGESFSNKSLRLKFHADMYESFFDEYPLQNASGNFIVTTDSIIFEDPFVVSYFENNFFTHGSIDYDGNMNLSVKAFLDNLDRYKEKLFIDQPAGRAYAEFVLDGSTSDPDLRGFLSSDSIWLYGLYADTLEALFEIDRFLSGRKGWVEAHMNNGSAWSVPYDTGYIYLDIDSNIVTIDTTLLTNQFTQLNSKGKFDYGTYPQKFQIDSLDLKLGTQRFYNRKSMQIDIDSAGFIFKKVSLGHQDQWLAFNGRSDFDETLDLLISVNHIPIEPWKNLYEDSININGILSCEASLTGNFSDPEFIVKAELDSFTYRDLYLGDVKAQLEYDDLLLQIDTLSVFSNPGMYSAEGSIYLDLSFTADSIDRLLDLPIDLRCTAFDRRFDLVSLMIPSVEVIKGNFFADFTVSGSPFEPHLEGAAYVKNYTDSLTNKVYPASLKYFDLESPIYTDSAGITMIDNKIIIESIQTYLMDDKQKRFANVSGEIIVKSFDNFFYDIDIDIPRPMPFTYELDDISGKIKGYLSIDGDTPPTVTGDIEIVEMKYLVNFAEVNEGSPIMSALSGENLWDLNIDITMNSNYWIKNEDIDAEFAGEINLKRESGVYKFAGELEILRGNGYLFDKTFRLDPGGAVIFEGDDKFNPSLDMTGYTRLPANRDRIEDGNNTSEQLKLGIHITGTLEEPELNVTDDSDFGSNEDIIPLIVANYSGSATEVSSSFEQRISGIVSTQVSQIGTKHLSSIGVETFEFNPNYSGGQFDPLESSVTLGKYVSPNLYLYGRSDLGFKTSQEIGFEYRFSKKLLLQGLRDEEELYHLNMKLSLEFK